MQKKKPKSPNAALIRRVWDLEQEVDILNRALFRFMVDIRHRIGQPACTRCVERWATYLDITDDDLEAMADRIVQIDDTADATAGHC